MKKIRVEYDIPIIVTKDASWINNNAENINCSPGAIWLLPDDAILIFPPVTVGVEVTKPVVEL